MAELKAMGKKSLFYRPRKTSVNRLLLTFRFFWIAFLLGALFILSLFIFFAKDLPNPEKISERQIVQSTKIFDRVGKVILYDIHGEEKRTIITFEEIPQYMKQATIAVEDSGFYQHFGFDFRGILRSIFYNLIGKKMLGTNVKVGGSTITQQFIKNAILTPEKTYTRKIKEAILAIEMEIKYSKDEILNFYLNQVPYGSNAYGVEAAAQTFFNKKAKDLTLAEAALLAALTQAPSYYSPYGSHTEILKSRQEYILERMYKLGYITKEESEKAKQEKLKFVPVKTAIKAPHFVMYVKEYLEQKYGQEMMEKGGLKVYTTLDWELQEAAEKIINEGAKNNWKKYRARNAALTAIDPKTGQILVMVGSYDYFDLENDGNVNVTIRDRQPGSSFKPFAYATAFKKGFTTDTIVFDLKTEFNPNCPASTDQEKDEYGLDCYHPGNYDDKFRGPVTARQALAQSLNVPSVQILYLAGVENTIKTAKEMGITGLNEPDRYGLSLVLGGGEVKLLDEVAAYGVFATEGIKNEKTSILKIEDSNGKIIEEYQSAPQKVIEKQETRLISDILSDNESRAPIFGAISPLYFPERPVAAKTGTTQGYRDAWTLGYTPSLAAGVWVGNNDNSPMAKAGAGIAAAGPLWHNFIDQAYKLKTECENQESTSFCLPSEAEQFTKPEPITTQKSMLNGSFVTIENVRVDKISGLLATNQTPPDLIEEKTFKSTHCILYYVKKDDPQGDPPSQPLDDPQYKNWEAAAQGWLVAQGENKNQLPPTQFDVLHNLSNLPKIKIVAPLAGQTIAQQKITIQAEVTASLGIKQVDFFLNDDFVGSVFSSPYQINISLPNNLPNGPAIIKVRAYDKALNRQEEEITTFINR